MRKSTIAAIATGMSQSGIGIIRISGEDSFNIALKIFRHKNGDYYSSFDSHRVYYGYIFDEIIPIDEVILLFMKGPKSFTGEDVIEIQCHGGIFILNKILDIVIKNGASVAEPGEFTKRAFLNGRLDLSSAESVMDLISSKNDFALANSFKQLRGNLYDKICEFRSSILYEVAYIESALDDPEHFDLTDFSDLLKVKIISILDELKILSSSFNDGRILSEGVKTVILGRPNVGKSSFLNLLAGANKAIVTDIAGTTRDIIEEHVVINGINLNIIDTAGIHKANDKVEEIGISKALNEIDNCDLIIFILDSSDYITDDDINIFNIIKSSNKNSLIILNKVDLDCKIFIDDIRKFSDSEVISFSTLTSFGVEEFNKFIYDSFISGCLKYNDELYISNIRHKENLDYAISSLEKVINSIECDLPEDFFTIDLNDAYFYLGLIIGEETSDDVVNEIFSKFCMGK